MLFVGPIFKYSLPSCPVSLRLHAFSVPRLLSLWQTIQGQVFSRICVFWLSPGIPSATLKSMLSAGFCDMLAGSVTNLRWVGWDKDSGNHVSAARNWHVTGLWAVMGRLVINCDTSFTVPHSFLLKSYQLKCFHVRTKALCFIPWVHFLLASTRHI